MLSYIILLLSLFISVTASPVNLTVSRDSLSEAALTWSPPISNSPIVQGYDVFYYDELSDGTSLMSVDVGNNTMVILDGLDPELSYTVLVVAYGGDLPSNNISGTISEGIFFSQCMIIHIMCMHII